MYWSGCNFGVYLNGEWSENFFRTAVWCNFIKFGVWTCRRRSDDVADCQKLKGRKQDTGEDVTSRRMQSSHHWDSLYTQRSVCVVAKEKDVILPTAAISETPSTRSILSGSCTDLATSLRGPNAMLPTGQRDDQSIANLKMIKDVRYDYFKLYLLQISLMKKILSFESTIN